MKVLDILYKTMIMSTKSHVASYLFLKYQNQKKLLVATNAGIKSHRLWASYSFCRVANHAPDGWNVNRETFRIGNCCNTQHHSTQSGTELPSKVCRFTQRQLPCERFGVNSQIICNTRKEMISTKMATVMMELLLRQFRINPQHFTPLSVPMCTILIHHFAHVCPIQCSPPPLWPASWAFLESLVQAQMPDEHCFFSWFFVQFVAILAEFRHKFVILFMLLWDQHVM